MNYTRPNDPDHQDDPMDWLHGSLIFARALSLILREGQGVVVDIDGDAKAPGYPDAKKVLVYYLNGMVHIEPTDQDWEEGDFLNVLDSYSDN
jgi:hypothetical protein